MEDVLLKDLIKAVNGSFLLGDPKMPVQGVSIDSRTLKKGQFYFALKGANYDGHDFIKEAIEKESAGIVYSRSDIDFEKTFPTRIPAIVKVEDTLIALGNLARAYRKKFKETAKIAGITGSNGKTTTKEILASIFNIAGSTLSNKGNFNNRIGLPLSVLQMNSDIKYAVFEMGTSLHGEIKILSEILQPDIGIITNIGFSHLETFHTPQGVFNEKRALLDNISEDGFIVLNNDDRILKTVSPKSYSKIITFALYGGADVYVKNITLRSDRPQFELFYGSKSINISMPVKGRFNILNALAAASAALGLGFNLDVVKAGIEYFKPPEMRMETHISDTGITLINDAYNANPSSVRESVAGVCEVYTDEDIILVLGDMLELGNNSAQYHFEIGEFINKQRVKAVYLIGDMTLHTQKALNIKKVVHTKDQDELLEVLKNSQADSKSVFLFKASRSMKLENVYKKFYNYLIKGKK